MFPSMHQRICAMSIPNHDMYVLTGNDNVLPVLLGEDVGVGLDLGEDEVVGSSGLAVLLGLSAAGDDLEALVEGILGLLGDLKVGLALAAALGVADDDPADAHVGEHVGGGLAGEGAVALDPAVLGADGDVGAELLLDALDVYLRGADDDLGVGGEGGLVDHGDEVVDLGDGAVALPVAADEELAGLRAGRGMEGAVGVSLRARSHGMFHSNSISNQYAGINSRHIMHPNRFDDSFHSVHSHSHSQIPFCCNLTNHQPQAKCIPTKIHHQFTSRKEIH